MITLSEVGNEGSVAGVAENVVLIWLLWTNWNNYGIIIEGANSISILRVLLSAPPNEYFIRSGDDDCGLVMIIHLELL